MPASDSGVKSGGPAGTQLFTTKSESFIERVMRMPANWSRRWSLFLYPFVTACCGMEYMSVASAHFDIARFGAEIPRFTPRQSDLLFVVGTISHKQAPIVRRVWEQMTEPRWCIAFGVCASTGGFYDNYAALPGVDRVVPVDVYIPGCPPRPEAILDGIMKLHEIIMADTSKPVRGVISE